MSKIEIPFTDWQDKYIETNYLTMSITSISKEIGISLSVVRRRLRILGLTVPEPIANQFKGGRKQLTEEQSDYVRTNYLKIPIKKMASDIGIPTSTLRGYLSDLGVIVPKDISNKLRNERIRKAKKIAKVKTLKKDTKPVQSKRIEDKVFKMIPFNPGTKKLVQIDRKTWVYREAQ